MSGRIVGNSVGHFEEVSAQELAQDDRITAIASAGMAGNVNRSQGDVQKDIMERVLENMKQLNAMEDSTVQRDQTYSGNNQGFVGYSLEKGAQFIVPQLTPFRNMTPRKPMGGIDLINVRTVLDYFNGAGPSIGGGVLDQQGSPQRLKYKFRNLSYTAKMIATSDVVTDETQIYAQSFESDVIAVASAKLIPALMQLEEMWLINSSQSAWTPPPPIITSSGSGGTLAAGNYWIAVTAKNANGETLPTAVQGPIALSGSTSSLNLTLFSVPDETIVQYNVYAALSASAPASSAMFVQVATNYTPNGVPVQTSGTAKGYQTVVLSSLANSGTALSTVTANTAVRYVSANASETGAALTFDGAQGLLYTNYNGGSFSGYGVSGEAPYIVQPASAGVLALTDLDTLLENMFISAHADPDYIFVSTKDHKKLSYLVSQGTNARVLLNADDPQSQGNLVAGYRATAFINQTTGKVIPIRMLPYLTQGTIMIGSFNLPYQVSGVDDAPFRIGYNREMYSRLYGPDQSHPTQTMVGAFLNECLINQYMGGWALINGILAQ